MNEEIPYKFKYMLNKIVNCIIEYIMKNISNYNLIESKLLLINNYILDLFHTPEISRNNFMNKKYKLLTHSSTFSDKTVSPEYDKNITLSKFSNIFINIVKKDRDDSNDNNKIIKLSPYRDSSKITKLKKLLKNEQEKSMIKELSYLKRLSYVQEKLNYYESKRNKNEKINNKNEIDNKSASSINFKEKKKIKSNLNNKFIKAINNLSHLTVINSCKNTKINLFNNNLIPNTPRLLKQSLTQRHVDGKDNKNLNIKIPNTKINLDKEGKLIELIKDKNNFINSYSEKI